VHLCRRCAIPGVLLALAYLAALRLHIDREGAWYDVFKVAPAFAAGLVVFGALYSPMMQRLLRARPAMFLGRISFASYLLHLSVIYGVGGWIFKWGLDASGNFGESFVVSYVVSLVALLLVASMFTKYVDAPAIALSRRLSDALMSRQASVRTAA
jgi:peptidoglycan/LPS O-acetylase OafA/YrhL